MKKKSKDVQNDLFIDEINEGLKQDQMQELWNKYGVYLIIAVAFILTLTVSFESIKSWRVRKSQEISNAFAVSLSLHSQGRSDESLNILKTISNANNGLYSDIAEIQTANILIDQGKNEEAYKILEYLVNSAENSQIANIAAIKLASYKLDTASAEELNNLLLPIAESQNSWTNIAKELLAMLNLRENNIEQAKELYTQIINSPDTKDTLKSRAQDMLSVINNAN